MFGHKSFLRIGALSDSSISGLYKDSYELDSCSYSFLQGTDANGKPQTDVRGGTIYLTYAGLPQDDMLRWMLGATKYEDGAIFNRQITDGGGVNTVLHISPDEFLINGISFDNHWV